MSESTDVFVITPNRQTFSSLKLKIWNLVIFKAALASQRQPSCPYKTLSFQTLRHPQLISNFQSPKFKFSFSGKRKFFCLELWQKHHYLLTKTYLYIVSEPLKSVACYNFSFSIFPQFFQIILLNKISFSVNGSGTNL